MKERLRQWMTGRYGLDPFGRFLNMLSLVLLIAGMLFSPLLVTISLALLIYEYFRMFSRNHWRRSQENEAYNAVRHKIKNGFSVKKRQFAERNTHRFFRCPSCRQYLRVPKGKGKISITCSHCQTQFVRKS